MWKQTCGWCAVIQLSVPQCYVLMGFVSRKMHGFILPEILDHNEERIKLCLLLFTVVSLDSKTKGYRSVIFLSFILQFFTVSGDMGIGNSMLHK